MRGMRAHERGWSAYRRGMKTYGRFGLEYMRRVGTSTWGSVVRIQKVSKSIWEWVVLLNERLLKHVVNGD